MATIKLLLSRVLLFSIPFATSLSATDMASAYNPAAPQQATLYHHIEKARAAIKKERYGEAEKELKQALLIDKNWPEANLLMGVVYRHKNRHNDAMRHVQEAVNQRPEYPDAHYLLALLLIDDNRLSEANKEIDLAIRQGAQHANIFVIKGTIELGSRLSDDALKSYEKALRLSMPDTKVAQELVKQIEALKSYIAFRAIREEFEAHKGDPAYKRPALQNRPMPIYSERARANRVEGTVLAAIEVDEAGKPASVLIFAGLGYGLDEQAIKAARKMKFSPATIGGKPVRFWIPLFIEFRIRG